MTENALRRTSLVHLPALAIGMLWFSVATWIVVAEHQTYNTTSRDIGVYLQVLWNGAHGRPFQTTLLESNRVHLAEHAALLLPFLAPAYAAFPDPRWLFVLQQAVLALSGIPVYLLARRRLGGEWLPTLVIAGFYATPTLDEIAFDAFYPITFTALPLAFGTYAVLMDRWRRGTACALVAVLMEEEAGLLLVGLGGFLLLRRHGRRWAAAVLGLGALWLVLIALVVMPRFHDPTTLPAGADNRTVGHFDELRQAPATALTTLLTDRVPLAARWLLAPTGGLALAAPEVLLITAPHAATLLLADKEGRFRRHWAAPMVPVIWLAAVVGLSRLRARLRVVGFALLVLGSVGSYLADSALPGGGDYEPDDVVWSSRADQLAYLVARVPREVSVAASRRALGHLADRSELYVFPPSYAGKLWPPERRPQAYVLDLTNDQTREALESRQSPLRAQRPYAIWLAGPSALMLTERPPAPSILVGREVGPFQLLGYDVQQDGASVDLTLHWLAPRRSIRPLTRLIRELDASGSVAAEQRGTVIDQLFPTSTWQDGQVLVERVELSDRGGRPGRIEAGWVGTGESFNRIEIDLSVR